MPTPHSALAQLFQTDMHTERQTFRQTETEYIYPVAVYIGDFIVY